MLDIDFSPSIWVLSAELDSLSQALQDKATRSGLVAAIKPVKSEMKSLAPRLSGALAGSIGHRTLSKSAKGRVGIGSDTVALLVGSTRKVGGRSQGKKALWQEFGTEHMDPNQFLAPALAAHESGLNSRFYEGLRASLDKLRK